MKPQVLPRQVAKDEYSATQWFLKEDFWVELLTQHCDLEEDLCNNKAFSGRELERNSHRLVVLKVDVNQKERGYHRVLYGKEKEETLF